MEGKPQSEPSLPEAGRADVATAYVQIIRKTRIKNAWGGGESFAFVVETPLSLQGVAWFNPRGFRVREVHGRPAVQEFRANTAIKNGHDLLQVCANSAQVCAAFASNGCPDLVDWAPWLHAVGVIDESSVRNNRIFQDLRRSEAPTCDSWVGPFAP